MEKPPANNPANKPSENFDDKDPYRLKTPIVKQGDRNTLQKIKNKFLSDPESKNILKTESAVLTEQSLALDELVRLYEEYAEIIGILPEIQEDKLIVAETIKEFQEEEMRNNSSTPIALILKQKNRSLELRYVYMGLIESKINGKIEEGAKLFQFREIPELEAKIAEMQAIVTELDYEAKNMQSLS